MPLYLAILFAFLSLMGLYESWTIPAPLRHPGRDRLDRDVGPGAPLTRRSTLPC